MGKSKKRILNKKTKQDFTFLRKDDAIKQVVKDVKMKDITEKTMRYIDLFGITPEDLTEEGVLYEEILSLRKFFI